MPSPSPSTAPAPSSPKGRILLVSHNFPPTQGPESSLVRLNTLDLLRRGWDLSVLTTTMEHFHQKMDPGMLKGLPADLEILRTPSYDGLLAQRWPKVGRHFLAVLRQWILPEVFLLWLFSSVPAGKRWLRQHGPVILYSRATKHVSNVTGYFLKRATGLPWVAHFSDPWMGWSPTWLQTWITRQLERRIFRDADALVFVNARLAEHMLRSHPQARAKAHIVEHGYAPLEMPPQPCATGGAHQPLTAIHAGSFIPTLREPDSLLKGLEILNRRRPLQGRLKIACVGEDTIRYQPMVDSFGLGDVVALHSSVPYAQCQTMTAESDLLLVIDSPDAGGIFLPTKLIEYLPFGKPILGLCEPDSAVNDVLQHCQHHFADPHFPEQIADVFEKLLSQWEAGQWGVSAATQALSTDYRIDQINNKLEAIFSGLQATHPALQSSPR